MNFKTLWIYIRNYCKTIYFLVIDITLASVNSSCFKKNILEKYKILIMTIDGKIRDEKLQYGINREAAKVSALSSGKSYRWKNIIIWSK